MLNIKFDRMTKYLLIHCFLLVSFLTQFLLFKLLQCPPTELIAGKQYALKGYITDYQSM